MICELYVHDHEGSLRQLRILPGFAFARFIRRPYIGFAARDGDDTCPYILDWESGLVKALIPPEEELSNPGDLPGWVGHVS